MSGVFGLLSLSCIAPHPNIHTSTISNPTRVSGLSGFPLQKDSGDELSHIWRGAHL